MLLVKCIGYQGVVPIGEGLSMKLRAHLLLNGFSPVVSIYSKLRDRNHEQEMPYYFLLKGVKVRNKHRLNNGRR